MWDEDPRWQAAQYRLIVGLLVFTLLCGNLLALVLQDWELFQYTWYGAALVVAPILAYGVIVWLIAQVVRGVYRLARALLKRKPSAC